MPSPLVSGSGAVSEPGGSGAVSKPCGSWGSGAAMVRAARQVRRARVRSLGEYMVVVIGWLNERLECAILDSRDCLGDIWR